MRHPVAQLSKGPLRALLVSVLAVAGVVVAVVLAGPAVAGTGYGQLIVDPGTVSPGESVSILG
ncbi:MAG TPA: hypothetical protein VH372_01020, partial [Actinospica sp.]|nr:hypothetical protein [Actinospica sp.]